MAKNNKTADRVQAMLNLIGGDDVLDALMSRRATIEVKMIPILNWLGTVTTSATTELFVAREKFRLDSEEVKFFGLENNFINWLLDGDDKIEKPQDERELRYGDIIKESGDRQIIEELGGAKAGITLSEVYSLLQKQGMGGDGVLLTSGLANVFYVLNTSGTQCAVIYVYWGSGGWIVNAYPKEYPRGWRAGCRVFSGNS